MVVPAGSGRVGPAVTPPAFRAAVADAYSVAGVPWRTGPSRIYDVLATEQLAAAGLPLAGAAALDLGAGTGAGTRALRAAGARVIAGVDVAVGMLRVDRRRRPPAVVADALALPFRAGVFDAVVAPFSLNHVDDPATAMREAARTVRHGGWVLVSSYATDDAHPVKDAVEQVLRRHGWTPAPWHSWLRSHAITRLATPERARRAAVDGGLVDVGVAARRVPFCDLGAAELVDWRMGMAQYATFVAGLDASLRGVVRREAVGALEGHDGPLVRSVLFLTGRVSRGGAPPRP